MKSYYALIVSIILHVLFFWGAGELASQFEKPVHSQPIEIEVREDDRKSEPRLIVRDILTPQEEVIDDEKTTRLLSRETRRYQKEQVAKEIGQTQNQPTSPGSTNKDRRQELEKKLTQLEKLSQEVIAAIQKERENAPEAQAKNDSDQSDNPLMIKGYRPSTVNDPLTNIPLGSFTALNTDRYLFYSFFERIEDRIRHRWVSRIRNAINSPMQIPTNGRDREVWTTELEVQLDSKGNFVRAEVHKSSGIEKFDYATIDAFREGAPIPNPPVGIIDEDGYIYLQYAFNVYWKPSPYARPGRKQ